MLIIKSWKSSAWCWFDEDNQEVSVQAVGDKDLTDVEDCQHTPGCKIMMIMFNMIIIIIFIFIIMEWNYMFKLVRTDEHVPSDVYNVQLHYTVVNIRIPKLCKQVLSILLVTHFKGCHITMVRVYYVGEIYNTNDPRRQQSKLEPKLGRYFRNVWEKILAAETIFCG